MTISSGCAVRGDRAVIRVASVPSNHVYVRHLRAMQSDGIIRLDDPAPEVEDCAPSQWWPPTMLNARWIEEHHQEFDIFHLHFGFDAHDADHLRDITATLHRYDKPLVYTVHDLRNPHHETRTAHDAHLDVLVRSADALITLTPGAAAQIAQHWGRQAVVIPHPHVVDFARMERPRSADPARFVVGVHAKSVRASMLPLPVIRALVPVVAELPGAELVVDVHCDVFERDGARHDPELRRFLETECARGRLRLAVHDCYSDVEFEDYLQSLDLSVLPYRFGTHSGWLEACYDLGTAVLAPDCGFYAQQRRCLTFATDEVGIDEASLQRAVRHAYERRPRWRATVFERRREREEIARAHRELYEAVLA